MSDVASNATSEPAGAFGVRTVMVLLAVGLVAFVGMVLLGAFAPDLRSGRNGGGHALSDGAIGFSGIVRLAEPTGRHPRIVRNPHQYGSEDLLVVTPPSGFTPLGDIVQPRRSKPTLLVMPKWQVAADPRHRGWVRRVGLMPSADPEDLLSPGTNFIVRRHPSGGRALVAASGFPDTIRLAAPRPLQVIAGQRPPTSRDGSKPPAALAFVPLLTDGQGGVVLGRLGEGPLYILSDPDLLANKGLRDRAQAGAALAMLDWLNSTGASGIDFDVTLNGLGHSPSPLKLLFEPPFLPMTLTLVAAALLAAFRALGRFGPVQRRERAIAFGKAALVDNSAALIRKARREASVGTRYAAMIRERASAKFGVPARLRGDDRDFYLDRLEGRARFTDLVRAIEAADDRARLVSTARALHDWQGETAR